MAKDLLLDKIVAHVTRLLSVARSTLYKSLQQIKNRWRRYPVRKELKPIRVETEKHYGCICLTQDYGDDKKAKIRIRPEQVDLLCVWLKEAQQDLDKNETR